MMLKLKIYTLLRLKFEGQIDLYVINVEELLALGEFTLFSKY